MKEFFSRFQIPKFFGIIAGSLSTFKLCSYLIQFRLSELFSLIIEQYDKLLYPIRIIFRPFFSWLAVQFQFTLPEWWPHALVLWMLIGTITLRASKVVDEKVGYPQENSFARIIANIILTVLGGLTLISMCLLWLKNKGLYGARSLPFKVLLQETFITLAMTVVLLVSNSFLP